MFTVCLDGMMCSDSLCRQCFISLRLPVIAISKNSEKDDRHNDEHETNAHETRNLKQISTIALIVKFPGPYGSACEESGVIDYWSAQ